MDIRKFFGPPSSGKNKKTPEQSKNKDSNVQKDDGSKTAKSPHLAGSNSKKKPFVTSSSRQTKSPAKSRSPQKKSSTSSTVKRATLEKEETVVIDDYSDEEVIKDSQPSTKGRKVNGSDKSEVKNKAGNKRTSSSDKRAKTVGDKDNNNISKSSKGSNKSEADDDIDLIEIESVNSIDSKDSHMSSSQGRKGSRGNKLKDKDGSIADSGKKKESKKSSDTNKKVGTRTSPRKNNSQFQEEAGKKTKRKVKQLSSDDEDDFIKVESDDDETEEVITSRRQRGRKGGAKQNKRAARVLESDSEEDPLGSDIPKRKKKKKEPITFVDESAVVPGNDLFLDEEKKVTAMDKFVLHNVKPSSEEEKKKKNDNSKASKGRPVSVQDFFGSGMTSRSDRSTAAVKRKQEETKKRDEVDLTFDEELHEDEDFLKTLDQLDGPDVKKARHAEKQDGTETKKETGVSLASKLAGKMNQSSPDVSVKDKVRNGKASSVSPVKEKKESPNKAGKATAGKKGKVYSMEVTKAKPSTIQVTPGKNVDKTEKTPQKTEARTPARKGNSSEKKPAAEKTEDDGFAPKGIGGFRAFKARGGPLALGSKEIPEGAENCLEGLIFVITGVLDSIERDDAKALIEKHGGKVTGNVSRKTSYLVVGREAGESKLAKIRELKVKQLDEDGLFDLVRSLPGKTSKYETQAKEQIKKEASVKEEKNKAAAKKLESFRSEKDMKTASTSAASPTKQRSLFTQIKSSSDSASASVPSPSSSKLLDQSQSPAQKSHDLSSSEPDTLLWVDKHKPTSLKQIIGQQGDKSNARKLLHWLKSWHENVIVKGLKPAGNFFGRGDGAGCRAALLSGPPGIGKTTSATLVCQEAGFSYVELNASDTRSKRSLKEEVAESLNNQTLVDYMGSHSGSPSGQSHCLIMDEVDGMAGNEDRGGLQELVQLIKGSKIPIICICNDRNSMKMRTLSNYCLDLRFQRPRVEQIKGAMMSIAFKEGLKIPPAAMNEIIQASNHDIRQVIHNMSMWSAADKTLTFEQVKADARKAQKDLRMGPFDVCRKVFVNDDETRKMSIHDKSDLFFQDYSFGPLFVHANYPHIIPSNARGNHSRHMSCLARTIDSICDGDLVDKLIRKEGNWNLLPAQAIYSSVIPGELMRGRFPQMPEFPQWLGKFSTTNKTHRILQELGTHMRLEISCDKRGLTLDYLPALRVRLTSPLTSKGAEGVPDVIKVMDDYDIIKEDFDNILEVSKWPHSFDPMSNLDTKTKAAFTRQYNKEIHLTPYATGVVSKKRKARGAPMDETDFPTEEGEGEVGDGAESEEEEETIEADTMIKSKKPSATKKGQGSSQKQSSGTVKGKGKGTRKGKR